MSPRGAPRDGSRHTGRCRAWLLGAASCCLVANAAHAEIDRAALVAASASVLRVEVQRAQGGLSLGSGVVVAPERVATNCHVTRDGGQAFVIRGGARWAVESQSSDAYHDVCVLRVPGLRATPVKLGDTKHLAIGQAVTALGYTGGVAIQVSGGEVVSLHRMDDALVVQSSNFFSSGASGGALFDDDLRLVGLLTFRMRGARAHYFAAPAEWLAARLQGQEASVKPLAAAELAFWQRPLADQPRFLRAAVLEHDANWAELRPLAQAWADADKSDPEGWYMLAIAFDGLNQARDAQHALECSLAAEPTFKPARTRLESIYLQQGRPATQAALPCQL
jgi:hypothetical protein